MCLNKRKKLNSTSPVHPNYCRLIAMLKVRWWKSWHFLREMTSFFHFCLQRRSMNVNTPGACPLWYYNSAPSFRFANSFFGWFEKTAVMVFRHLFVLYHLLLTVLLLQDRMNRFSTRIFDHLFSKLRFSQGFLNHSLLYQFFEKMPAQQPSLATPPPGLVDSIRLKEYQKVR